MASGLISVGNSFGDQVKKLTTRSELQTDNFVFTLHQRGSFVIILVGLLFSTGNNYLNKDAMICKGGDSYVNNFCFLHGSSHIAKELQGEISVDASCINKDEVDANGDKVRTTHYYIWLPFVLAIVAIITKLPWILWKNVLERGLMKKLVADMDQDGSKTAERILAVVRGRNSNSGIYNFGFAFCEFLNIVVVIVSMSILNALLNGEFSSYGTNVQTYMSFVPNPNLYEQTPPANPMCHLFPTEVSCNVKSGGITFAANKDNVLCLLPNNVFYQYFFLILWWWYVVLLSISCVGLVFRLLQIFLPKFGRMQLNSMLGAMGLSENQLRKEKLTTSATFLLLRLVRNLKGSQVIKLFEAMEQNTKMSQQKDFTEESL